MTAPMASRVLYLVRHGQSTWNTAGRVQGQYGAPALTGLGRVQAERAALDLLGSGAATLVTSDAVRARQTADIIARRLRLRAHPTPLLRERHWGVLQGRPLAEAAAAERLLADDEAVDGGESRAAVRDRLRRLLTWPVLETGPAPVVVVTHGDVLVEALRLWGRHSASGGRPTVPANGSVTRVCIEDWTHRWPPSPQLAICERVRQS